MPAHGPDDRLPTGGEKTKLFIKTYWKILFVIITPFALLPIVITHNNPTFKCLYVVCLMALYWVLETLPLSVTSMIPIVLFPVMGVLDSDRVCAAYMKETAMMFLGGLMIAVGVQHSRLPKRVALAVVRLVGCSHLRLTFGLSFVTMFISMWVANAATTTMMVPIVQGMLEVLEQQGLIQVFKKKGGDAEKEVRLKPDEEDIEPTDITVCYYLTIAYAASIGGSTTLVGTATNSAFKGIFDTEFPDIEVNFFYFLLYSAPLFLTLQFLVWVSLGFIFLGLFRPQSKNANLAIINKENAKSTMSVIDDQYKKLGPPTFHEKAAGLLFILAVFLFVFRKPDFIPGWAEQISDLKIKDGVVTILIVILMFLIPMTPSFLRFFKPNITYNELASLKSSPGIVTWKLLLEKIPWGLLFLLGGGFAIAAASKESGLSAMIGEQLTGLRGYPPILILFVVVLVTQMITELTSNTAICNLLLPVLANMARILELDPRFLMIPATHACSMAFLLPVGTPPNAIVAGVARINTATLARGGVIPKIISILLLTFAYPLYGGLIFPSHISNKAAEAVEVFPLVCNTTVSDINSGVNKFSCYYAGSSTALSGTFEATYTPATFFFM